MPPQAARRLRISEQFFWMRMCNLPVHVCVDSLHFRYVSNFDPAEWDLLSRSELGHGGAALMATERLVISCGETIRIQHLFYFISGSTGMKWRVILRLNVLQKQFSDLLLNLHHFFSFFFFTQIRIRKKLWIFRSYYKWSVFNCLFCVGTITFCLINVEQKMRCCSNLIQTITFFVPFCANTD